MKKDKKHPETEIDQENLENVELTENEQPQSKEEVSEEIQVLKDELLRALAETENVKKRCAAEIEKNNKYAVSSFAKDLLGVADNLQRALQSVSESASDECQALLKGVELTQNELTHVFEKFGISKMDALDQPFDPNFHRAVQEIEDQTKPAGTILAELQAGYMINGRILREAMVVVSKK